MLIYSYFQVKTSHEVSGRKFSIKAMQEDHLSRMNELGVLRSLNSENMTAAEASSFLSKHGKSQPKTLKLCLMRADSNP